MIEAAVDCILHGVLDTIAESVPTGMVGGRAAAGGVPGVPGMFGGMAGSAGSAAKPAEAGGNAAAKPATEAGGNAAAKPATEAGGNAAAKPAEAGGNAAAKPAEAGGLAGLAGKAGGLTDMAGKAGSMMSGMPGKAGKVGKALEMAGKAGAMLGKGNASSGDSSALLMAAAGKAADKVGKALNNVLARKFSPQQLGFGVAVLLIVFLMGWIDGLTQSQNACVSASDCDAVAIMGSMVMALGNMWMLVGMIVILMYFVEVVVVGIITKPITQDVDETEDPTVQSEKMLAIWVLFSWMIEPSMLFAIGTSLAMTGAFAAGYVLWLYLREAPDEEYKPLVYNVYMFQLASVVAIVVCEFWLLEWWKR